MAELLIFVLSMLLLFVATWIAIFGGIGMLLSADRGGSALAGLAWGTVFGAGGWLVIVWRTRRHPQAKTPGPAEEWPLLSGDVGGFE